MNIQTYLFFDGCCEEAIEFYREVFGAELEFIMPFKDAPPAVQFEGSEGKVFHATLKFGGTTLNMADLPPRDVEKFAGFALLVHLTDISDAEKVFVALGDGGNVRMPMEEQFWATRYGIVADQFGVTWKIQVSN